MKLWGYMQCDNLKRFRAIKSTCSAVWYFLAVSFCSNAISQDSNKATEWIGKSLDSHTSRLIETLNRNESKLPFSDLENLIVGAFQSTPSVIQLIEAEKRLHSQLVAAQSDAKPRIYGAVDHGYRSVESGVDGNTGNLTIGVRQLLYDFSATQFNISETEFANEAIRSDMARQKSAIILELIKGYFEVLRNEEIYQLTTLHADSQRDFQKYLEEKFRLGVASQVDFLRAQTQTMQAEANLPSVIADRATAEDNFERLFGVKPVMVQWVKEYPELSAKLAHVDWQLGHSGLRAADLRVSATSQVLEKVDRERYGSLSLDASVKRSEDPSNVSQNADVIVSYRVDLYTSGAREAAVVEASTAKVEAEYERTRVERDIVSRESSARYRMINLKTEADLTMKLLSASKKDYQSLLDLFIFNRGTLSDVFKGQDQVFSAAKDAVNSAVNAQISIYQWMHEADLLREVFEKRL